MSIGFLPLFREDGTLRENFIYILVCYDQVDGPIYMKIGRSMCPGTRLTDIKVGCPVQARILYSAPIYPFSAAHKAEKAIHRSLADSRIRGEWFRSKSAEPLKDDQEFFRAVANALRVCGVRRAEWSTIDVVAHEAANQKLRLLKAKETRRTNLTVVSKKRRDAHRADREAVERVLAMMRRETGT